MTSIIVDLRRYGPQTQPVFIPVPLDVFQLLLSAGNSANPPRSVKDLLLERIASPGLSICKPDIRRAVMDIAVADHTLPDTLIAEWVRRIVEDEYRIVEAAN